MRNRYKIFLLLLFSGFIFSHGISESDKTEIVQGSLMDYLYLGAKHMITGYDHILFLIGVIFFFIALATTQKQTPKFTRRLLIASIVYLPVLLAVSIIDQIIAV